MAVLRNRKSTGGSPLPKKSPKKVSDSIQAPLTTHFEFMGPHGTILALLGLPLVTVGLYLGCTDKGCPVLNVDDLIPNSWWDYQAALCYLSWIVWHLLLAKIAPGPTRKGTRLRNGITLDYKLNAFSTLVIDALGLGYLAYNRGLAPFLWVAEHYFHLATAGIVFCILFSFILHLGSYRSDQVLVALGGNSGYPIYDYWIGRELNPRWFDIDLKCVCELRPGLIGWEVLNICLAVKQYHSLGHVTSTLWAVLAFQGYYVFDAVCKIDLDLE